MGIYLSAAYGILKDIEKRPIGRSLFTARPKTDKQLLDILRESEQVTDNELDRAIKSGLHLEAQQAIKHMQKCDSYADHSCTYPEHLAYAIQNNLLTKKELRVVENHLDHEKDLEEFCERYCGERDIVAETRKRILNPPEIPGFTCEEWDPHPVCLECGY